MTDSNEPHVTVRTAGPPRLGGTLGRYQLLETLGHGAMATVFRARDTNLQREVAIKVMTLAVAARADSAERFRREAQAVAAVKHPGIVEVFDFVAARPEEGEPAYIVSELIKGPTLRAFLDGRRGRLLPESAALIALSLAEALQAAHVRGVVHRDIKPDNVMLERGADARVVLTDFGVAHVTGLETMTATGALVGSPSYMSPEQGRGDDVGPASDLFSLGILLYEMATGHLPFVGRDPLQVLAAIGRGVYKRPGQVSPFVGAGFDEICCRCLRAVASERFADAGALAEALRGFCAQAGVAVGGGAGTDPGGNAGLRAFLADPETFEAALRPKVADAAVAAARKHARRGELARALGELSRATAYVPGHAEAERLRASISSRQRWAKGAAVAGGLMAIAGGVWFGLPRVRGWLGEAAVPTVVVRNETAARALAKDAPPATNEVVRDALPAPSVASKARKEAARRPSVRKPPVEKPAAEKDAVGATATGATPPGATPPGATTDGTSGTTTAIPTPAPVPPPEAAPAVRPPTVPAIVPVVLRAGQGFCDPGIDALGPQLSPVETRVKSGRHHIHCTVPGTPTWSTDLEIGPTADGTPFVIQLVRGPDGKPRIDSKRTSKPAPGPAASDPAHAPSVAPLPAD